MPTDDVAAFTQEEYQRRFAALKSLMAQGRIDAVLITTESNHRYFTGHQTHRWTHKYTGIFALLPLQGEPVLIVPPGEAEMCVEDSWIEAIRAFPPLRVRQGVEAMAAAVRDLGLQEGRIGTELGGMVSMHMPVEDFGQLQSDVPGVEFVDATPLMWKVRARKSAAEVDLIRQAVAITDEAYDVLFDTVEPGMTEREVHRMLAVEHLSRGAEIPGSITMAPYIPGSQRVCDQTLRRPTDRALTAGELITQDAGGVYRGYWSDYTRMFALGQACDAHKELYGIIYDCLQAAIAATRPGVAITDLVHASNAVLTERGYGEHADKVAGIGHATGLDVIEPPIIGFENNVLLEEGMVLTIEPGLFAEGAFFMLEEDVVVTDTSAEVLSAPAPAELPIL